jgi:uncharacterized protein involved in response to NO
LVVLIIFVIAKVVQPDHPMTAYLAVLTGFLHAVRLLRWKGWAVVSEPLMWVLHLGYAWLVVALILIGLTGLTDFLSPTSAIHALTAGAFGTMILAMMTRASLGHTGRELKASAGTTAIFVLITIAAVLRVAAPELGEWAIWLAGGAWTLGYGLFSVLYFPVFTQPRVQAPKPSPIPQQKG